MVVARKTEGGNNGSGLLSGIHSILSVPAIYDLAQTLVGASQDRNWMQREFIRAKAGERVLDVGCGTADILSVMPEVDYVGFDISEPYIAKAKARWGSRGEFMRSSWIVPVSSAMANLT